MKTKTKTKIKPAPKLKTIITAVRKVEKWNGRPIEKRITFKEKGTFESYYKASTWLDENGYSKGSMARTMPIGLLKGDFNIAKWYNLGNEDIASLDGVLVSNDFREGQAEVILFKK